MLLLIKPTFSFHLLYLCHLFFNSFSLRSITLLMNVFFLIFKLVFHVSQSIFHFQFSCKPMCYYSKTEFLAQDWATVEHWCNYIMLRNNITGKTFYTPFIVHTIFTLPWQCVSFDYGQSYLSVTNFFHYKSSSKERRTPEWDNIDQKIQM